MKCPYCMDEIPDQAIVCKTCGRDFVLLVPLISRVAALERQFAEFASQLAELSTKQQPALSRPLSQSASLRDPISIIALLVLSILSGTFPQLMDQVASIRWSHSFFWFPLVVPLILPVPVAIFLGYRLIPRFSVSITIGAVQALVFLCAVIARYDGGLSWSRVTISCSLCAIAASSAIYIGKGIAVRRHSQASSSSTSERIVRGIIGNSSESRVKHVAEIITALAPILTLIGSIMTGYFTYLGALAKGAK